MSQPVPAKKSKALLGNGAAALIFAASLGLGAAVLPPSAAHADGIYRWVDEFGRVHYGTNPPKSAGTVAPVAGHSFSRYSASKLLKPYHSILASQTNRTSNEVGDEPVSATVSHVKGGGFRSIAPGAGSAKASLRPVIQGTRPKAAAHGPDGSARASIREETIVSDLSQGALDIQHDEKRRVTRCRIPVQNTSSIPAQGVIVSFEFTDGTLIPGIGPDSLGPGEEATYSIPDEFLPVVIKNLPEGSDVPAPQVSVKASS